MRLARKRPLRFSGPNPYLKNKGRFAIPHLRFGRHRFNFEVPLCRTASGSDWMHALNVESARTLLFIVDRSIRSLPLAVLDQLHSTFESPNDNEKCQMLKGVLLFMSRRRVLGRGQKSSLDASTCASAFTICLASSEP